AVAEKVTALGDLSAAMGRARASKTTYAIVIDTDPHKATEAGGTWWDVAVAQVSPSEKTRAARQNYETARKKQRLGD
ncbi:MAG: 3D-(3,5/4)-trihydroxycyclohexane-1,2-dione acylhydrolase (decyclizing), partial [Alphaproteobacteria bacterium]